MAAPAADPTTPAHSRDLVEELILERMLRAHLAHLRVERVPQDGPAATPAPAAPASATPALAMESTHNDVVAAVERVSVQVAGPARRAAPSRP